MAREGQQKIGAIYRGVASEKPSSLADAVSASVRRYRPVAFPLGVFEATAAGPAAGAHRAPFAPSAVHRGRSGAHVHALLVDAPLDSRKRNTQRPLYYLCPAGWKNAICPAGYSPPRAPHEYQFPARRVARSFLTLQFISPARLNLRPPLASAPKATKSTSARSDAREEGASFNKSLPACAGRERKREEETAFYSATFPTAFRDAERTS